MKKNIKDMNLAKEEKLKYVTKINKLFKFHRIFQIHRQNKQKMLKYKHEVKKNKFAQPQRPLKKGGGCAKKEKPKEMA